MSVHLAGIFPGMSLPQYDYPTTGSLDIDHGSLHQDELYSPMARKELCIALGGNHTL